MYFVYYSYAIVCQFVSLYTMSYFIHQFLCCYSIADILGSLSGVVCYLSYNLLMCICIIFCEIFMLFEICYCCLSSLISISQESSLKPLNQIKPIAATKVPDWAPFKFVFNSPVLCPRWPQLLKNIFLKIVLYFCFK